MLFTDCHPLTGECLSCMHDTAGPHCGACAPGYYGDAIAAKNCTSELSFVGVASLALTGCKAAVFTPAQDATVPRAAPSHVTLARASAAVKWASPVRAATAAW